MAKNEMSLENLAMPAGFSDPAALAEIQSMVEAASGVCDDGAYIDYDSDMKDAHEGMYRNVPCHMYIMGLGVGRIQKCQDDEMMRLLGLSDIKSCRDYFVNHEAHDPVMADILLADAIKSGKWQELPDELQDEYHRRMAVKGGTE